MNYGAVKSTVAACILGSLLIASAVAAQLSPAGLWKSIDDATGKPTALIRITDEHGEFKGKIEKLFLSPAEDTNPRCTQCTDTRKNQPIIGMTIVDGMRAEGDGFGGGRILDPDNGSVYKSRMMLTDGGKKLEVRGYIGVPMLGRTQVWLREP